MSYCRFSSDDFQCDVYVYACSAGWDTHVAAARFVYAEPLPPKIQVGAGDDERWGAYLVREKIVRKMRAKATLEPIGLPHDGASFTDPTAGACADRLEALRAEGYNVPQYAIDRLREEEE